MELTSKKLIFVIMVIAIIGLILCIHLLGNSNITDERLPLPTNPPLPNSSIDSSLSDSSDMNKGHVSIPRLPTLTGLPIVFNVKSNTKLTEIIPGQKWSLDVRPGDSITIEITYHLNIEVIKQIHGTVNVEKLSFTLVRGYIEGKARETEVKAINGVSLSIRDLKCIIEPRGINTYVLKIDVANNAKSSIVYVVVFSASYSVGEKGGGSVMGGIKINVV